MLFLIIAKSLKVSQAIIIKQAFVKTKNNNLRTLPFSLLRSVLYLYSSLPKKRGFCLGVKGSKVRNKTENNASEQQKDILLGLTSSSNPKQQQNPQSKTQARDSFKFTVELREL